MARAYGCSSGRRTRRDRRELGKASIEVFDGQLPGSELADAGGVREKAALREGVQCGDPRRVAALAVVIAHARGVESSSGKMRLIRLLLPTPEGPTNAEILSCSARSGLHS